LFKVTDHSKLALARVVEYLKNQPNWANLITACTLECQRIEDSLWDLLTKRSIDDGFGAQLDGIGQIVGQPRNGMDDAQYRVWLKSKIYLNFSSGTGEELIGLFDALLDGYTVEVAEYPHASFALKLAGAELTDPQTYRDVLQDAKPAAVEVALEYLSDTNANTFTMDSGGLGFGDSSNAATGGKFAGAL
jgi:hypothetical protein